MSAFLMLIFVPTEAASDTEGAQTRLGCLWGYEASCALPRCAAAGVRACERLLTGHWVRARYGASGNLLFERSAGLAEGICSPGRRRRTGEQIPEERRAERRKASLQRPGCLGDRRRSLAPGSEGRAEGARDLRRENWQAEPTAASTTAIALLPSKDNYNELLL